MEIIFRTAIFFLGLAFIASTLLSAIRTFVLPRSANDPLTRVVFTFIWQLFRLRMIPTRSFKERDQIAALYAPIGLLVLPPTWLTSCFSVTQDYISRSGHRLGMKRFG